MIGVFCPSRCSSEARQNNSSASSGTHILTDRAVSHGDPEKLEVESLRSLFRATERYSGFHTTQTSIDGFTWTIPSDLPLMLTVQTVLPFVYPRTRQPVLPLGEPILYRGSCQCPENREALK